MIEAIGNLVRQHRPAKSQTERGELLIYFRDGVNAEQDGNKYRKVGIGYIAKKLEKLELNDLYYMRSVLEDERRRGRSFGKAFFGMLKPRITN
jgi:hypothetical protein